MLLSNNLPAVRWVGGPEIEVMIKSLPPFPSSLPLSLSLFKIQFYCLVDRNSDWWSYCTKVLRAFE